MEYLCLIADIECLEDYFSLQVKTSQDSEVTIYECRTLQDCIDIYKFLSNNISPFYFYSINYDKLMLASLCKLVEREDVNILCNLRIISNYSIKGVNFKVLRSNFWKMFFNTKFDDFKTHYENTLKQYLTSLHGLDLEFVTTFNFLFCESKVYKQQNIIELPKALYYYNIDKNNNIKPSISLKNLQLVNEGYSIKFDFNKYTKMKDIEEDGRYEEFIAYAKNDITSLENVFNGRPLSDINIRLKAVEAVQQIQSTFTYTNDMIYAENNTKLINHILKVDNKVIPNINYCDEIKTNNETFNRFVTHCNNLQHIIKDTDIKDAWNTSNKIEEDGFRVVNENSVEYIVNSVDVITINNSHIKFGLGGLHADNGNYIGDDLIHLDYVSMYPSIILQYKEYFKDIINVDLYEQIYIMRNNTKDEALRSGLKLILNSAFGLINSSFNIPIACKKLGRFICLKGQSILLNLIDKLPKDNMLINVNTDGIIIKLNDSFDIDTFIKNDKNGYFKLGMTNIDNLIQRDVNNYYKKISGNWKGKGLFKPSIKQRLNINEKLSVNLENALNLIQNKDVEIKPIYFKTNKFRDLENCAYYLTTHGQSIIKDTVKPEVLGFSTSPFQFTTIVEEAEIDVYRQFAELTKEQLLSFSYTTNKTIIKHYDVILKEDTIENNTAIKTAKRQLAKIFESKNLGLTGYKGDLKKDCYSNRTPISTLRHYTMTQILNSTACKGISLYANNTYTIIDVDIYDKNTKKAKIGWEVCKPLLLELKNADTFECWNRLTKGYNKKFIFKYNSEFKIPEKLQSYVEIVEKAVLWTVDIDVNKYDCNFKKIKDLVLTNVLL